MRMMFGPNILKCILFSVFQKKYFTLNVYKLLCIMANKCLTIIISLKCFPTYLNTHLKFYSVYLEKHSEILF